MLILTLCLYFTLAACGLAIGLFILRYDLYRHEPWYLILTALALGAAAMWIAGQLQVAIIHACTSQGWTMPNALLAVIAGSTEEFAKFSVVVLLWAALARHFDEPIDGLIYGSFAGLGAALEESVFVLSRSHINGYLPPTEPVRLCGHLVMGGIGAFGLGLLTIRSRWTIPVIVAGLLAAAGLHAAWDIAAFSASDLYRLRLRVEAWHTAVPIALMLTGMVAYRRLAAVGASLTRRKLQVCDVHTRACAPSLPRYNGPVSSPAASALAAARAALDAFMADHAAVERIDRIAALLAERFAAGRKVLICGNGGSACDAMHFAEELTGRFKEDRPALPAIACADPGHITCTANDYGFEHVFSRWVEALGKKGDVLIVLSTSGNSPNILRAVEAAAKLDMQTVGLLGRGGGKLQDACEHEIVVPGETSDRIQEVHMLILHALVEAVEGIMFA